MSRAGFLGLGALAGASALGAALPRPAAALTTTPRGDDEGYLQVGLTGERILAAYYARAARSPGFTPADRARLRRAVPLRRANVRRVLAALGDTPASDLAGLVVTLPAARLRTRADALALGIEIEHTLQGAYVRGLTFAQDPGTRALLARLLAGSSQHLQFLQTLAGHPGPPALPGAIGIERAGSRFDRFLTTPGSP